MEILKETLWYSSTYRKEGVWGSYKAPHLGGGVGSSGDRAVGVACPALKLLEKAGSLR